MLNRYQFINKNTGKTIGVIAYSIEQAISDMTATMQRHANEYSFLEIDNSIWEDDDSECY